jgi:hypothetical protein
VFHVPTVRSSMRRRKGSCGLTPPWRRCTVPHTTGSPTSLRWNVPDTPNPAQRRLDRFARSLGRLRSRTADFHALVNKAALAKRLIQRRLTMCAQLAPSTAHSRPKRQLSQKERLRECLRLARVAGELRQSAEALMKIARDLQCRSDQLLTAGAARKPTRRLR